TAASLLDSPPRRPHDSIRRVPRRVRAELNREDGGEGYRVDSLQSAFQFTRDLEAAGFRLDARHDARMGEAEDPGDESSGRRVHEIVRLHAGQHEVARQRADRRLTRSRGSVRIAAARRRATLPTSYAAGSSNAIRVTSSAPFAS